MSESDATAPFFFFSAEKAELSARKFHRFADKKPPSGLFSPGKLAFQNKISPSEPMIPALKTAAGAKNRPKNLITNCNTHDDTVNKS